MFAGKSDLFTSYRELLTMMKEAAKCRQFQVWFGYKKTSIVLLKVSSKV
jgi:hypothetical protein